MRRIRLPFALVLLVLVQALALSPAGAAATGLSLTPIRAVSDSSDVVATVDRYHAALAAGDSVTVAGLLAPDALILETGGVETRAQYLGGHLRGDIAFAAAVPREQGPISVQLRGDVAWATSTSTTRGDYRGRPINSVSAELMILVRTGQGWRIAAIHWSSRNRPTGGE